MIRVFLGMAIVAVTAMACASQSTQDWQSDHYVEGEGFINPNQKPVEPGFFRFLGIIQRFLTDEAIDTEAFDQIPYDMISTPQLEAQEQDVAYRLGHSTVLLKLSGKYILTDPIFSDRASPMQWIGPERFHPVPIDVQALPKIFAVIISHDHYDHLDQSTIELLAERVQHFLVPLGVAEYLEDWGVPSENIHELDWWQSREFGEFKFVSTPSKHFSGRGLFSRNSTLWSSWVIQSPRQNIYFSGDSGYFDGFKTIGEKYGPFDLTILENGAYNPDWAQVHMFPAETVQAHMDLTGNAMLPVHNGTFKLAFHTWYDPLEQVTTLAEEKGILVQTPIMGEQVSVDAPKWFEKWWRPLSNATQMADKN